MRLTLQRKLAILADAAKYDASCASLGDETLRARLTPEAKRLSLF